jgi:hypothetical protein
MQSKVLSQRGLALVDRRSFAFSGPKLGPNKSSHNTRTEKTVVEGIVGNRIYIS